MLSSALGYRRQAHAQSRRYKCLPARITINWFRCNYEKQAQESNCHVGYFLKGPFCIHRMQNTSHPLPSEAQILETKIYKNRVRITFRSGEIFAARSARCFLNYHIVSADPAFKIKKIGRSHVIHTYKIFTVRSARKLATPCRASSSHSPHQFITLNSKARLSKTQSISIRENVTLLRV